MVFHQILQLHGPAAAGHVVGTNPHVGPGRPEGEQVPGQDIPPGNLAGRGVRRGAAVADQAAGPSTRGHALVRTYFVWRARPGVGVFNLVESLVDHHILQLHHVYEAEGLSGWDHACLVWGLVLASGGVPMARARFASESMHEA